METFLKYLIKHFQEIFIKQLRIWQKINFKNCNNYPEELFSIFIWTWFCDTWNRASLRWRPVQASLAWGEIYVCAQSQPCSQTLPTMSLLCKHFTKHRNQIYCRWNSLLCRGLSQVSVLHKSCLNTISKLHKSTALAWNFPWKNSLSPLKRMYFDSIYHSLLSNT